MLLMSFGCQMSAQCTFTTNFQFVTCNSCFQKVSCQVYFQSYILGLYVSFVLHVSDFISVLNVRMLFLQDIAFAMKTSIVIRDTVRMYNMHLYSTCNVIVSDLPLSR